MSSSPSSPARNHGHQPLVVGGCGRDIAHTEVTRAEPLPPGSHSGARMDSGAGQQDSLVHREGLGRGTP
jgi:hypothetical protein